MTPDRRIDEYAARQYGVFSHDQVVAAGITPRMVETRIANGAWIRMVPTVYALASAPPKWERQMAAAVLSRPEAIVAGKSAAYLLRFEGFSPGRPVIMVPLEGNARSSLATVIRSKHFHSISTLRTRGFVCTDPCETVVTLARSLEPSALERTVDSCVAGRTFTVDQLAHTVEMRAGQPGIVQLRGIVRDRLEDAWVPPMSELERMLHRLLASPGVPETQRQRPFEMKHVRMTVDVFIPEWGLIVEADGRNWHMRQADIQRDRLRDNEATAHGLAVLRFTYQMLHNEPDRCLETLLRTGAVRRVS